MPSELEILRQFVEAHDKPHPNTGDRVPIWFVQYFGGSSIQHHGFDEPPEGVDEALLEEMHAKGLISIDYREHSMNITPTALGRQVVDEAARVHASEPVAEVAPIIEAVTSQAEASNQLAWIVVRPVLVALRGYWQAGGFSGHGIQLAAIAGALPDAELPLFGATIRSLVRGGYLAEEGNLRTVLQNEQGDRVEFPGEVAITEKAHAVLEGWPGAAPEELVENLLAVIVATAAHESDPTRKRRLEKLGESIREVGVSVTSEVIAKVLTGLA